MAQSKQTEGADKRYLKKKKKEYGDPQHKGLSNGGDERRWEGDASRLDEGGRGGSCELYLEALGGGGEAASVIRTETNGGEGGGERAERALHSAQGGGDWSRELESVRGALCSSGEGAMGKNELHVLQRKSSIIISPSPGQPQNLDASFTFSSFLSISCCFLGQNCRTVGKI